MMNTVLVLILHYSRHLTIKIKVTTFIIFRIRRLWDPLLSGRNKRHIHVKLAQMISFHEIVIKKEFIHVKALLKTWHLKFFVPV